MVDELVKAETPLGQRHVARVLRVGDVEVVLGSITWTVPCSSVAKRPDIGATNRTLVAAGPHGPAEMQQPAERLSSAASSVIATTCPSTDTLSMLDDGWAVRKTGVGEHGQSSRDNAVSAAVRRRRTRPIAQG